MCRSTENSLTPFGLKARASSSCPALISFESAGFDATTGCVLLSCLLLSLFSGWSYLSDSNLSGSFVPVGSFVRCHFHGRPVVSVEAKLARDIDATLNIELHSSSMPPCVFTSDLARLPNFAMQVRSCACPALLGQVSTARTCGRDRQ